MKQKYFAFDGLPTKPDVDLLMKHYGQIQEGDKIPYSDVERLIEHDFRSNRFRIITTAWRKRMLDQGIVIECQAGEYFFAAKADEVTANTYGVLTQITRKTRKHRRKLLTVDIETDSQRAIIHHQSRIMHELERDSKKQRTHLLPDTSIKK